MTLHLGKRAATYDPRDIRYSDVRAGVQLPIIPSPRGGYGTDFVNWGVGGNGPCDDGSIPTGQAAYGGCGDCAWAGPGHETMESHKNSGKPVPSFSCKTIVSQYSAYCGYDPQSGANDNGSNIREVLSWRQSKGLLDDQGVAHKVGVYVSLEPGNFQDLWEALYLFEAVGIGIQFPESAMDQFNAGQAWSVVPGAQIVGGHYIPLVGHPTQNVWTCVTWGKRQTITPQFLTKYCDEAWCWIDPERYSQVTGQTLEHYRDADLEAYIKLVAFPQQSAA